MIIVALLLVTFTAGLTVPELTCSKSNTLSTADYTIVIIPEVQVLAAAEIHIQFPSIYNLLSVPLANSSFSLVNNSILRYQLPSLLKGISYTLLMPQVVNPSLVGSSGLFSVYTYKGSLLIEQNLTARMVGLAGPQVSLVNPSIYLDSNSLPTAGEIAYYNFIFTINVSVSYTVSVWLLIPSEFVVPAQPSCSTFGINQQSSNSVLKCYSLASQNVIVVEQYNSGLLSVGDRLAIKVSLLNPNKTGTTGNFSVLVYKSSTTYVVSSYYNVTGVVIHQGNIYSAKFSPYNPYALQGKNKVMDYQLSFTPKNPLSSNNSIVIDLPVGFTLLVGSGYDYVRIIQGTSGGKLTWTSTQIVIANATVLGNIMVIMRLQNPPTAGGTNQLLISTYDKGILVDQNNLLSTSIQDVDSDQVRTFPTFQITFSPLMNYTAATLIVSNLQVNSPQCQLNGSTINCYSLNGQVFFGNGNLTFTANQLSTLAITNLNYYPGTYLLDVSLKDSNSGSKQSSSAVVIIPSNSFSSAAVQIIDQEISVPPQYNRTSIIVITFVTDYQATGAIRLAFGCGACSTFLANAVVKPVRGLNAHIYESILTTMPDPQTYELSNFITVPAGTYVEIHVAGITNPLSNGGYWLTVTNQLETTLSLIVFDSFVAPLNYETTPNMEYGYSAISFNLSASNVDNQFILEFPPMFNGDLDNVHLIVELPGYDTMFLRQKNTVACQIDGTFYECITYPKVDWVMIKNIPVLYMTNPVTGLKPTVKLYGLQWPTYSDTVGYLTWRAIDTTTLIQKDRKTLGNIIGNTTFTAPNSTALAWGRLALSDTASGAPGVAMFFNFQTSTLIPNQSVIELSFPNEFSLNTSNPVPTIEAPMFSDASPTLPVTITVGKTTVTFANVSAVPQLSTFSITLRGVRIPSIASLPNSTNNFTLKVTKNGKAVTSISNFDTLHYSTAFQMDRIAAQLIVGKPVTSLTSLYTLQLEPIHSIPKYGSVQIHFPFNLSFLSCGLVGAVSDFSSCTLASDNRTLTITLAENYYTGVFNITLQDVINPSTAGSYTVGVSTIYDGVIMDSITLATQLYSIANTITATVAATPTSEGEWGIYNLTVTLTLPADTIMVSLSSGFSPEAQQFATTGQFIAGTYYIGFGSVNPSSFRNNTIGILSWKQGTAIEKGSVNYTSSASPNWLQLNSYLLNDSMVGRGIQISLSMVVPQLQSISTAGSLQIEFDTRFDCTYATLLGSSVPLQLSSTATVITLQSQTVVTGLITVNLSLLNPNISGTYSFSMRSQTSQAILSRTFSNMDYLDLKISDIGPAFWVNYNQSLLVYQNTVSGYYQLQVGYPSRLSFVVIPIVLAQGIYIVPSIIEIGLYSTNASFQIVASSASPGTYQVKWSIQSAVYRTFYNPIVESTIVVITCPAMNIMVQPVNLVPVSGTSLPLQLSIPFAPTTPLQVTITPVAADPFIYSSTTLLFANATSAWFSINSTLSSISSSFFQGTLFSLSSNHSNYTLSVSQFSVISLPYDSQPPFVSQLNLIEQQRDHVVVSVGTSQLSVVHLVVQHWYDPPPEITNHLLLPVVSTPVITTLTVNLTVSVLQNITVYGLSSSTHYILYCMAVDRGGNDSPMRSLEFQTSSHLPALQILYPFAQPNITSQERDSILIPQLAFYLSLPTTYLISPYTTTLYTSQSAGQYLQGVFYQPLWVVINDSYTPAQMLKELEGSLTYIQQFLPHTSVTTKIAYSEVSWRIPNVLNVSASQTIGKLTVSVTLDYYGTVYVSAYQKQLNYTYQVQQLANCTGVVVDTLKFTCSFPADTATIYFIHAAVGDVGPLFPILSSNLLSINITTLPAEQVYHLNINYWPIATMPILITSLSLLLMAL